MTTPLRRALELWHSHAHPERHLVGADGALWVPPAALRAFRLDPLRKRPALVAKERRRVPIILRTEVRPLPALLTHSVPPVIKVTVHQLDAPLVEVATVADAMPLYPVRRQAGPPTPVALQRKITLAVGLALGGAAARGVLLVGVVAGLAVVVLDAVAAPLPAPLHLLAVRTLPLSAVGLLAFPALFAEAPLLAAAIGPQAAPAAAAAAHALGTVCVDAVRLAVLIGRLFVGGPGQNGRMLISRIPQLLLVGVLWASRIRPHLERLSPLHLREELVQLPGIPAADRQAQAAAGSCRRRITLQPSPAGAPTPKDPHQGVRGLLGVHAVDPRRRLTQGQVVDVGPERCPLQAPQHLRELLADEALVAVRTEALLQHERPGGSVLAEEALNLLHAVAAELDALVRQDGAPHRRSAVEPRRDLKPRLELPPQLHPALVAGAVGEQLLEALIAAEGHHEVLLHLDRCTPSGDAPRHPKPAPAAGDSRLAEGALEPLELAKQGRAVGACELQVPRLKPELALQEVATTGAARSRRGARGHCSQSTAQQAPELLRLRLRGGHRPGHLRQLRGLHKMCAISG